MAYYKKKTCKKVVQGISFLVLLVLLVPSVNADFTVNDSLNLSYCKSSLNSIDTKLTTTNSDLSQINSTLVTLNSNVLTTNTNMNSQLTSVNTKLTNIYTDVNGIKADFDTLLSEYSDLISDVAELRDLVDLITTKIDSIDTKLLTISTTLTQFKVQNHTDLVQIDDDILSQTEELTDKIQDLIDNLVGGVVDEQNSSISSSIVYNSNFINNTVVTASKSPYDGFKSTSKYFEFSNIERNFSYTVTITGVTNINYFALIPGILTNVPVQYNILRNFYVTSGSYSFTLPTNYSNYTMLVAGNNMSNVSVNITKNTPGLTGVNDSVIEQGQQTQQQIQDSSDMLNNTMTNTDASTSDIDLPSADMSGAPDTSTALNGFFTTLKNAFTVEGVQSVDIPIPFVNQSITITSGVAMDRLPANLKNLISMVYWFIISRYIFLDVTRRIDKIKEGNVEGAVSSNIKEDLL